MADSHQVVGISNNFPTPTIFTGVVPTHNKFNGMENNFLSFCETKMERWQLKQDAYQTLHCSWRFCKWVVLTLYKLIIWCKCIRKVFREPLVCLLGIFHQDQLSQGKRFKWILPLHNISYRNWYAVVYIVLNWYRLDVLGEKFYSKTTWLLNSINPVLWSKRALKKGSINISKF